MEADLKPFEFLYEVPSRIFSEEDFCDRCGRRLSDFSKTYVWAVEVKEITRKLGKRWFCPVCDLLLFYTKKGTFER